MGHDTLGEKGHVNSRWCLRRRASFDRTRSLLGAVYHLWGSWLRLFYFLLFHFAFFSFLLFFDGLRFYGIVTSLAGSL
jgi:hypothetical protein